MKKSLFVVASLLTLTAAMAGCTPIGAGVAAGSTVGVAAAREGGLKSSLEDTRISAKINDLWFKHDFEMFRKLNLTVDQGRVLITGVVQKPEHRVEAVRLAWQADGVKQVINEVKVANSEGITGWARDNWISGRLRALILFDKDIQGVNYSIDTVQSIVYLMGVGQNQGELDKVTAHARSVPYVKQVVSYVKLAGTPMNQIIPPSGNTTGSGSASVQPVQAQPLNTYNAGQQQPPYNPAYNDGFDTNYNEGYVPPVTQTRQVPGRPAPIADGGF